MRADGELPSTAISSNDCMMAGGPWTGSWVEFLVACAPRGHPAALGGFSLACMDLYHPQTLYSIIPFHSCGGAWKDAVTLSCSSNDASR